MDKYYYVGSGNQACGPILPTEFMANGLTANSMVCRVGHQSWTRLGDIPELAAYIAPTVPPITPTPPAANSLPPDNNMVWAILSTVFCCLPIGIYAIIQASKVHDLWRSGYYDAAVKAANDARRWSFIGAVVSIVACAIYFVLALLIGFAS